MSTAPPLIRHVAIGSLTRGNLANKQKNQMFRTLYIAKLLNLFITDKKKLFYFLCACCFDDKRFVLHHFCWTNFTYNDKVLRKRILHNRSNVRILLKIRPHTPKKLNGATVEARWFSGYRVRLVVDRPCFDSLAESDQKTLKLGIHSFPA